MCEHQNETTLSRHIAPNDGSNERRKLERSIAQVHCDQRCIQRAASVATLFLLLLIAGFAYGTILPGNFLYSLPEVVFNLLCALALASLICLVVFAGILTVYRLKLNRLREDCRLSVKRPQESQLREPHIATLPASQRASDDRAAFHGTAQASD